MGKKSKSKPKPSVKEEEAVEAEVVSEKQPVLQKIKSLVFTKNALLILLIFLVAFGVRGHLMQEQYQYFFEFDSYFHARMTEYLLENGTLPEDGKDPLAYYQIGYSGVPETGPLFWQINSIFYKVGSPFIVGYCKIAHQNPIFTDPSTKFLDIFGCNTHLGTLADVPLSLNIPLNQELLIWWVKFLPAFYGGLIAVGVFFLISLVFGRKAGVAAGLASGLVAALTPAFVYRTMAGFYEEDSFGFLWMVYGLYFLFRAIKNPKMDKSHLGSAAIAGVIFGLYSYAYGFFLVNVVLLLFYLPFGLYIIYTRYGKEKLKPFIANYGLMFVLMSIIASTKDGANWIFLVTSAIFEDIPFGDFTFIAGLFFVLIVGGFFTYLLWSAAKRDPTKKERYLSLAPSVVLVIALFVLVFLIIDPTGFSTEKFQASGVLGGTIGEESKGSNAFGEKYNVMIVIPIIALLLVPYRIYRNKKDHLTVFLFFWIFITLVMAWYKLKFTYTFGLPIAIATGIVVAEFFQFFGKDGKALETKVFGLAIGFLLLSAVGAGTMFVTKNVPTIEQEPQWVEAMEWIKENTEKDAKLFNWWSQGHWLSFLTERQVYIDNRNYDFESNSKFAQFVVARDLNKSLKIIDDAGSDYVILERGLLNLNSMLVYANKSVNLDVQNPEIRPYMFTLPDPSGTSLRALNGFLQLSCQGGGEVVNCSGISFSQEDYTNLPVGWANNPITLDQDDLALAYRVGDASNPGLLLLSIGTNESTIAHLLLGDPNVRPFFEQVYNKSGILIYKVNKDNIKAELAQS